MMHHLLPLIQKEKILLILSKKVLLSLPIQRSIGIVKQSISLPVSLLENVRVFFIMKQVEKFLNYKHLF